LLYGNPPVVDWPKQGITWNFASQEVYRIFRISPAQMDTLHYNHYIVNQAEHHRARTFGEEYLALLTKNKIEFNKNTPAVG
jgi:hypothetical protein